MIQVKSSEGSSGRVAIGTEKSRDKYVGSRVIRTWCLIGWSFNLPLLYVCFFVFILSH